MNQAFEPTPLQGLHDRFRVRQPENRAAESTPPKVSACRCRRLRSKDAYRRTCCLPVLAVPICMILSGDLISPSVSQIITHILEDRLAKALLRATRTLIIEQIGQP